MCFVLYAGTSQPMALKPFRVEAPDLSVAALNDHDRLIATHFSLPAVQYVGSTSGCGCDFPNVMLQDGEWPWFEDGDESEPGRAASDRLNRERLVDLLRETGEPAVELYGVWDGDFAKPPAAREQIDVTVLLDPRFRFKEQGFYVVQMS